jgi:hypothetical protein
VLTIRSAAALLQSASSIDSLDPLAQALGFTVPSAPLDRDARRQLGIPEGFTEARMATGPGTLRALVLSASNDASLRELLPRLATRSGRASPHLLLLTLAVNTARGEVALAAWSGDRSPPKTSALVAQRDHIVDSDAETLCALAAATGAVDVLAHARWNDVLGRDALTRRFYRTLEQVVSAMAATADGRINEEVRHEIALLCVSRMIFLSFLEAKGWLDDDRGFLMRKFSECAASGGNYHRRVLTPLFFGTLNTPRRSRARAALALGRIPFLNGGLFARSPAEQKHSRMFFPDEVLGLLHGDLLTRYRFTAREDSSTWSEAAIDPEMLGKAFESLMASRERRASGAYYTPNTLVESAADAALASHLRTHFLGTPMHDAALAAVMHGQQPPEAVAAELRRTVERIRILDPACGSGAFLVHLLERLADIRGALGDNRNVVERRRAVLTTSIFGVDRNPMAVWLCELRLWLSMVIESDIRDPGKVAPLPNLDHHIRVGDTLAGGAFDIVADGRAPGTHPPRGSSAATASTGRNSSAHLATLRTRYARATGTRKRALARTLDREERRHAIALADARLESMCTERRRLLGMLRGRDLFGERHKPTAADSAALESLRARIRELRRQRRSLATGGALPFAFAAQFADAAHAGGFDIVLGNPPWVRLHHIPPVERARLKAELSVFRSPGWTRGSEGASAGAGFSGQADLSAAFAERSLQLLRPGGTLGLLLPAKLWRSLAGGGFRRLLTNSARVTELADWSESRPAFDAAVYPSLLVATREKQDQPQQNGAEPGNGSRQLTASLHRRDAEFRWEMPLASLGFDNSAGAPWLMIPTEVRQAFDAITAAGIPLSDSRIGRPWLGVKSGCNEAFVVQQRGGDAELAIIEAAGRRGVVEKTMLRPLIRGETVRAWQASSAEQVIWTHDEHGTPLERIPEHARRWLSPWRRRLAARTDAHSRGRWWALFRTESAGTRTPRVVWPDFGRAPRAAVLHDGDPTVPLNSCYVARCHDLRDAYTLAALLNGPLASSWLHVLAEPARGGYHRYLGWTVALMPVPRDWELARSILAPLGEQACNGGNISAAELLEGGLKAFRLRHAQVAALLTWGAR